MKQGQIVRHTGKFIRSIGMFAGAPVNGLVLGHSGRWLVVAWSDGNTSRVNPANVEPDPRRADPGRRHLAEARRGLHAWRVAERAEGVTP